jgi:2-polyprenyl-3-methyl-5-hydroxy-6-metoxy-1,4-benzoquinol methylase
VTEPRRKVTKPRANDGSRARRLGRCPACGARGAQPFARASRLQLVRCPLCTLVYADPQARAAVRARYLHEYDLAAHFEPLGRRKQVLYERRLKRLNPGAGGRRLCDVGCADGQFLEIAQLAGWEATGIELNPPAVAKARKTGATVHEGALEELEGLRWRTFDVVTCWDVLEHTPEPGIFAQKLSRLVLPGGLLFITTLNWDSLVRRIRGMHWSMIADEHFTYWTEKALRHLFECEGMEVCASESFGLGRDLVRPFDALATRVRKIPPSNGSGTSQTRSRWDTNSAVLLAERLVNLALRATGSGVGLEATFRAPRV